ncbi:Polyphosphate:nucleotide phosphotransferase, PPK2 family [Acidipropionibacterium acidipropionici ATCC 4875]|uniref:Polyphosphate:nucleotide phosphotransferase, PPK2 family n=1 Tax=Acidipropionibacterium acidipropionici (strain ATCC 4875 / DSM 20272 / JCM 6432 / NBRC 12425 / NCIMB 8070 / 4) TaxID=1171373 RepID=K7RST0_ACIA4|nr:PPK2 family polyphosphate--nucleotide phosphotransferase [Acidipropionibacterium acidipropionici]AFV89451.1 Polyphosphate:nucleotide phosphotransferase, PPK2 family [Acidipropionibacterium acidipropionici ATCC 4875]ALN16083.1 phosphate--nucleotide phosphotransferase [Acidipropionibacterium acidipropionici]APZ08168.1 PPK2 family polyphosphate--nucleotide phosphotransferase [Acidipropionibacterium acidipropionici]QCV95114.1 PPK2 family polyphosphate--nucleotide phosphotransferase [Acidipropion
MDQHERILIGDLLRCPQGQVDVPSLDAAATPGARGGRKEALAQMDELGAELSELQERLFARGRAEPQQARRMLVVLQGLDTAGKGGVVRHTFGLVDPQGIRLKAFKAPTPEELEHDFLWRIRRELPGPGMIGVFDRSHYEDVLAVRVNRLVEESVWRARFETINRFEAELAASGTHVVKCFLNVSKGEQKERLAARLEDPAKYWKYSSSDLDTRSHWDGYMDAYGEVLQRTNPDIAPWYVIPADHKWYRNWAVARIMLETLRGMQLTWPPASFDVAEERRRVARS